MPYTLDFEASSYNLCKYGGYAGPSLLALMDSLTLYEVSLAKIIYRLEKHSKVRRSVAYGTEKLFEKGCIKVTRT
jgi:hypothetical protein